MTERFKPLLAADIMKEKSLEQLAYPLLGSSKYDGIRGLRLEAGLMSRKLKMIPNPRVRALLELDSLIDCEGELIAGDPCAPNCMQATTSAVMGRDGDATQVHFYVFDWFGNLAIPYSERYYYLKELSRTWPQRVHLVPQRQLNNLEEVLAFEQEEIERGLEGVMLRRPEAPYKCGRSTMREQYLMKLKRFEDAEATIILVVEGETNQNEQKENALGQMKRSKRAEGMKPNGTLGHFVVKDRNNFGHTLFRIGSGPGLTLELRVQLWRDRVKLIGDRVKYRFQRVGVKTSPRFPRFISLRDERDL